jgi:hypothetical protein
MPEWDFGCGRKNCEIFLYHLILCLQIRYALKSTLFWYVASCSWIEIHECFSGMHGRRVCQTDNQQEASGKQSKPCAHSVSSHWLSLRSFWPILDPGFPHMVPSACHLILADFFGSVILCPQGGDCIPLKHQWTSNWISWMVHRHHCENLKLRLSIHHFGWHLIQQTVHYLLYIWSDW